MTDQAITYPLALPTVRAPRATRFELRYLVGAGSSPFSGITQVHDWGGRVWAFEAQYGPMSRAHFDEFLAFFAKLRGRYGTFLAGDWDRRTPRGSISGSPLIDGAGQTGNLIAVKGLAESTSGLWLPGDPIQIGYRLHIAVASVASDSSGMANVQIEPELRESPADETPIIYSAPKGLFRLAGNSVPWDSDAAAAHGFTISAIEAL